MRRSPSEKHVVFLIILLCSSVLCWTQERMLTAGSEAVRYRPRPEQGYVLRYSAEAEPLAASINLEHATPIPGANRHGLRAVRNQGSTLENERAIAALKERRQVTYLAPLFSSNDRIVAIIPEIVVHLRHGTGRGQLDAACEKIGCAIDKQMDFTEREYLLSVLGPDAEAVFLAVDKLNAVPFVEWAAPNQAFAPRCCELVFPDDEYFPDQWHLNNTGQTNGSLDADINAPEAWELETGDPNIVIAVLDTGVDSNHPDLVANLVPGYDFYDDDDSPEPDTNAHGTSVAGIIAASGNNGLGITGVTWSCSIMPVRTNIWADWGLVPESEVATAIRWAAVNGADIMNNSWAESIPIPIIHSAIIDVTKPDGIGRNGKGCVFLTSAGNEYGPMFWPALYPEVITVGASTHKDKRASFSSYGTELDIVAPGQSIWTTDMVDPEDITTGYATGDYYRWFTGTSASCPVAAGVAALILSVDPNLTNEEVRLILRQSARDLGQPGRDDFYGWGRVDARAAVEMALAGIEPWYVDDDAPNDPGPNDANLSDPSENGSADHPFDTIQEALAIALDAETVILRPGRYTGPGNRDIDFLGKAVTVRSADGPTDCVVDCQGLGRGFSFHWGEGPRSVVEGLTVMGGISQEGGGAYLKDSSPTIRHCIFRNNQATLTGGGLHIAGQSEPLVQNCTFAWNTSLVTGGAIHVASGAPVMRNCTVVRNKAMDRGAGVSTSNDGPVTLANCILWDNAPGQLLGNPVVSFSNIQDGWAGPGNMNEDPLFADPDTGDFHLKSQAGRWDRATATWVRDDATSPCIDAGDPNAPLADEPAPNGDTINQGAYGGTAQASRTQ